MSIVLGEQPKHLSAVGETAVDAHAKDRHFALASDLLPRLASGDASPLDASTAGLLARLRAH
jgi:hypothetical protein